jgi:hypothetical protein
VTRFLPAFCAASLVEAGFGAFRLREGETRTLELRPDAVFVEVRPVLTYLSSKEKSTRWQSSAQTGTK